MNWLLRLALLLALAGAARADSFSPPTPVWTDYTPVVTAQNGTITASASGKVLIFGKLAFFQVDASISNNAPGTTAGSGALIITLPTQGGGSAFEGGGQEIVNTGKSLQVLVGNNATTINVRYYDTTYPGANNGRYIISGFYMLP